MSIYPPDDIQEVIEELKDDVNYRLNIHEQTAHDVFIWLLLEEFRYYKYDVLGCGFTKNQWSEVSDAFNNLYKEIDSERYEQVKHIITSLFKWSDMK